MNEEYITCNLVIKNSEIYFLNKRNYMVLFLKSANLTLDIG